MKILKIKTNNFKSFYGDFELDFEKIKGMWKIVGPVGSGKTSIGEAIIFGLFGTVKNKNNTSLISWGEKHALVEIWSESKGNSIYIKREINSYGQSPSYVEVNGKELVYTDKRDIQNQLESEYYDISKTMVELLCVISFNNFKSISSLNTQDARKFLDNVLGFATLTQYIDVAKSMKSENYNDVINTQSLINQCNAQIEKIDELTNTELIEGDIKEISETIKNINNNIKIIKENYESQEKLIRDDIENISTELASVKALGINKAKEIEFIKKGTCPTCGAPIDQSTLSIKEQERDVLRNQYISIESKLKDYKSNLQQQKSQYSIDIQPLKDELEKNKTLLIRLQEQSKRSNISSNEIDRIYNELKEYEGKLKQALFEDQQWGLLINMLADDIRSNILDSFIPILNENILKYSQQLHQPYIITYDNQFKCQVKLIGMEQEVPISSLSTGQLKTIDMIVILAILGTVMGNNSLNVVFLDELFSNMHSDLRNEMCWLLRENMKEDDTIFTVSHYEINEGFFNGTLNLKLESAGEYRQKTNVELKIND